MERKHRKGGLQLGRTLVIVIAVHVIGAGGVLFIAQTEAGKQVIKQYRVKLAQEEKPPEPPKDTPPPPPPPPIAQEAVAPEVSQVAAAAPSASVGPELGGGDGGGGLRYGGKYVAPEGGKLGAFHASVERRFRQYYQAPSDEFQSFALELQVDAQGTIASYRLARSSGSEGNDKAVMLAASRLQRDGVAPPPGGGSRHVTLKGTPY